MKNKAVKIVITVLVIIVIVISGYTIYNKSLNKEKPRQNKIEKEEVEEENLDEIAQLLVDKLERYAVDAYDALESVDFKTMEDSEIIMGAYIYSTMKKNSQDLNKRDVDEYFSNLFRKNLTEYPDLECWVNDGALYKFNKEINNYESSCGNSEVCHGHGGMSIPLSSIINYNEIRKEKNNYIITVTKAFPPTQGLYETEESEFYADGKYTVTLPELSQFVIEDEIENFKIDEKGAKRYYLENYDNFKDVKPQYRYIFEKINNDYYLTEFETIK